jgi:hypothetical protein
MVTKPAYDIADLILCCDENPERVHLIGKTLEDAQNIFKLHTAPEIKKFIVNNGLEKLTFINTKRWKNNPNPRTPILVDAYEFETGKISGYIAFFMNKKGEWTIKSFHQSNDCSG